MLMYDINHAAFKSFIEINPNIANLKYFYLDDQGFNCFKVVRSAEMIDHSQSKNNQIIHE